MNRTRTFVDAGVLIAAARGDDEVAQIALALLDDPDRSFLSSDFVRLEVIPKPKYEKRRDEVAFYEEFFAAAEVVVSSPALVVRAEAEACQAGLNALDALHVVAAAESGADELVTTERTSKPMFRTRAVRVRSLHRE